MAWSPDGRWLATGGQSRLLTIWDVAAGRKVAEIRRTHTITDLAFSPDSSALAVASTDDLVRIVPATWRK